MLHVAVASIHIVLAGAYSGLSMQTDVLRVIVFHSAAWNHGICVS